MKNFVYALSLLFAAGCGQLSQEQQEELGIRSKPSITSRSRTRPGSIRLKWNSEGTIDLEYSIIELADKNSFEVTVTRASDLAVEKKIVISETTSENQFKFIRELFAETAKIDASLECDHCTTVSRFTVIRSSGVSTVYQNPVSKNTTSDDRFRSLSFFLLDSVR